MTLRDLETEILETEILKQVVILYSNLLRNICTIVLEILLVCRNVVGIQLNDTSGRSYDWKKKSHQDFVLINKQSKILHFDAQFFSIFPNLFVERLGIVVIPRDYT